MNTTVSSKTNQRTKDRFYWRGRGGEERDVGGGGRGGVPFAHLPLDLHTLRIVFHMLPVECAQLCKRFMTEREYTRFTVCKKPHGKNQFGIMGVRLPRC
jgi:hypothetical protein